MQITILENADQIGYEAAKACERILNDAIREQGEARIVLSTGASQFEFLQHFVTMNVPWEKVEMFHLDEYIALPESHPASFRKYLKERFLEFVNVRRAWLIDGEGDVEATIRSLNEAIAAKPVDLALIGIGVNAHIAFNDPPADFETESPYIVVTLDDVCKMQQVGEGWFPTVDDVPKQAITMSVKQILKSRNIVSVVPHAVKADAIAGTLGGDVDPNVPASILKTHPAWQLYVDHASISKVVKMK
jgi:glucosamine-6-phosphate deaminase